MTDRAKQWRMRKKAQGLCVTCGQRKALAGKLLCEVDNSKLRSRLRKYRRAQKVLESLGD
jgi:hypothetical protein